PKGATPEGIFGMAGNVWEWCFDVWNSEIYKKREEGVRDPTVTEGDTSGRALRGGSWLFGAGDLRASYRDRDDAWFRGSLVGFRVCLCVRCRPSMVSW
ncbi:MAG: SUMF1/EgtB/PvdO family nonheme iron enzyme, partial [Gammaproteobacteria bacterium]|nr:SUMF1/EgtB/PvdO family nonheme iron enzyme [Gammaproteobacteria bacterium]